MSDSGLIYLLWSDLVGMTRTRAVPLRDFEKRLESGLGWACAGQAMTPFEHLADNPWGPVDEVRQIPDPETRFEIPPADGHPALHAVICDSRPAPGEEWGACVRSFCRNAVADLKAETRFGSNRRVRVGVSPRRAGLRDRGAVLFRRRRLPAQPSHLARKRC